MAGESTYQYIQEDIEELIRLRKKIALEKGSFQAFFDYQQQYLLFLTTLKIAVNDGTLKDYEAAELKEEYAYYGGE